MAYKLVFTESFERDLDSVLDYIINKLYAPTAAADLYAQIKKTFSAVADFPEMFPIHSLKKHNDKEYRFFIVGNYLVFYSVDKENCIIYARAMVYGLMDLPAL